MRVPKYSCGGYPELYVLNFLDFEEFIKTYYNNVFAFTCMDIFLSVWHDGFTRESKQKYKILNYRRKLYKL